MSIKTTKKIMIRPFIPCSKDEKKEGREPYAILKYGNIEVELDYSIISMINLDSKALVKTSSIFHASLEEIRKEMEYKLYGILPRYHRDNLETEQHTRNITHNPLCPIKNEHIFWKRKDK